MTNLNFRTVIKAVGTGPKGNRDLSKKEIEFTINSILNRTFSDAQIGAFLQAWRLGGESHISLKYAYDLIVNKIVAKNIEKNSILLAYAYDGKIRNPYLLILASKFLKETKISLSIDKIIPAKNGVTTDDLYKNKLLNNVVLNDRADYLKELSNLSTLRNELELRTAFNTIEKLLNPANSRYAIVGYTHGAYKEFYTSLRKSAGVERLVVVKGGDEGSPDISKPCKIYVINETKEFEIDLKLKDFDIVGIATKYNKTKDEIISLMSHNDIDEKLIKLNTALLLVASTKFDDINEAYNSVI